ncbi:MAG: hypothetical protein CUN48_16510 [Candidatus Thermofonsia Clade 3 bacterium]|uniref:Uncharacterized protein n=1 Tax=Candidatus Thermofonsia Clade 3 bacterium TaxID=2364212 RepID=A0A2M8Q7X4_9CHLR|nr:MAG: hypothetical protein CUN48_16510 [Candidatus Thermofonsia Clade 3 bacterium]
MTRAELIDKIARAIAEMEGFYATATKPTLSQRNANPGNIRQWRDARGKPYPTYRGYVDFVAWASERFSGLSREEMSRRALEEGWRILRVLVGQYLDGRYTQGKPPTTEEMFRVYAPSADGNHPASYARFVAGRIGARPDQRLIDLVTV